MKKIRNVLLCLVILLTGLIYFVVQAQGKNEMHRNNFSGKWKAKQSISMGGNIVCTYVAGDRMRSETMKIKEQPDFLSIETANPSPGASLTTSKEILTFDGKESQINHDRGSGKKYTAHLSPDGRTMTVNSVVNLMTATPYNVKVQKPVLVYVTEIWKLSNDGKSITVLTNAKSIIFRKERSWKTVFNKVS